MRVAFVLRSVEVQPLFRDLCWEPLVLGQFSPPPYSYRLCVIPPMCYNPPSPLPRGAACLWRVAPHPPKHVCTVAVVAGLSLL